MFSNARNVVFTGNPTFTSHVIDRVPSVPTEESLDEGIKILMNHVAKGAMHNSGERVDAPTCHPETRIALQDDVFRWVDDHSDRRLITWLYGPAGAGKSAIAQTISQKLHAKGQLTASFFFSRTSSSKGRSDESALVATLAYQLSISAPATKPLIARAVRENPLIFDLSLDDQVQALIVHPLTCAYRDIPGYHCPSVVVVDGIDECRKANNTQQRVVRALANIAHQSLKLLITSRSEHNIVAVFRSFKPQLVRKMELNNEWNPDSDIRAFLHAEFSEIRSLHPYFDSHSPDQPWPSSADIDAIVERSSSQFIYASTVIKYIKSEDYYDPTARLQTVLQLENNEDQPYAELDALYEYIFSQIRDVEKILAILSLERMHHSESGYIAPLSIILPDLIGERMEAIKFRFRPLVSLVVWEEDVIQYMHASLPDFLLDHSRSNSLSINSISIASKMVRRALDLLKDNSILMKHHLMPALLRIPRHYTERLSPHHKIHIHSMISDFDVLDVLCRLDAGHLTYGLTIALASYLEWILIESKNQNPLECRKALVRPLCQIQTWLLQHLSYKSFNGLDNIDQIDLWPFLILPDGLRKRRAERRRISEHIASALEICGPPTSSYQLSRDQGVELSNQMILLYCLLPHIRLWLASTDLLGRYAITKERYAVAFLRTSRFILRLPADLFTEVLKDISQNEDKLSASMILATPAFTLLLQLIPHTIDLYFVVLFMYSAITAHSRVHGSGGHYTGHNPITGYNPVHSAKSYLELMRKEFPLLDDPTSPEYIRAQEKIEAKWVGFKRDPHDPV